MKSRRAGDSNSGLVSLDDCELCRGAGGEPIVTSRRWRVVRVDDADFPAYYRVIWNSHVGEFSDLAPAERAQCMDVVACVERVLREQLMPTKVNLASLGNMVAHLHWHVIARFDWDSRFPQPVWSAARRAVEPSAAARLAVPLARLDAALRAALPA
jgi:diadenosine tetraphosphate (Ap4A) HIT family hydrolase